MAGGVVVYNGRGKDYPGKLTMFVLFTCMIAATGGLIYGYDIGISGGVTSMNPFLMKFFPAVYRMEQEAEKNQSNQYCNFDSPLLTMFASSLYLAALVASVFASTVIRIGGRNWSMFGGDVTILVGAALNGAAKNVLMLIVGRVLLGIGVGFANQSVPLYLSEMAPARLRGMLNIGFQLMVTIGILCANLVKYGTAKIKGGWGWRVSLALAAVPATIIAVGALFLPDTPNSLIDRGHTDDARRLLGRVRGTDKIEEEYNDLLEASKKSKRVTNPWRNILERQYRPQLTMAIAIPLFTQLTGINAIMFYAPLLFKTLGFDDDASLMSAVITGLVNVFATFVSIFSVDRIGRRKLFLLGGTQMLACQIAVGSLIGAMFGFSGVANIPKAYAASVVSLICIYVAGFAWSWGPLGWLVNSEIFPLEIRSAGQSINVSVNMLFTFIIAQAFLPMLCRFKFILFFFFVAWVVIMTLFVAFFLPETNNVPIEKMVHVWKEHWYWRRFFRDEDVHVRADVVRS